jgi:hypothetical protein
MSGEGGGAPAVGAEATDAQKLKVVSEAYTKIKQQNVVLKKAVVEQQAKEAESAARLTALETQLSEKASEIRTKEIALRRALEENDALQFNAQSLTKRMAALQQASGGDNSNNSNNNSNSVAGALPKGALSGRHANAASDDDAGDLVLMLQKELAAKLTDIGAIPILCTFFHFSFIFFALCFL